MLGLEQYIQKIKDLTQRAKMKEDFVLTSLYQEIVVLLRELDARRKEIYQPRTLRVFIHESESSGPLKWKAWCPDLPENPPVSTGATATEAVGLLIQTLDCERTLWEKFSQIPRVSKI